MALVLITDSQIKCATGGKVTLSASHPLKVNGKSVIVPSEANGTITGCGTQNSNSTKTCTASSGASGASSVLKVGGVAVAIDSLTATSDGNPDASTPMTVTDAGQTILKA